MEKVVRVGLVEDHGLMLEGLVAVLSSDPRFEVVGTATSLADFKQRAALVGGCRCDRLRLAGRHWRRSGPARAVDDARNLGAHDLRCRTAHVPRRGDRSWVRRVRQQGHGKHRIGRCHHDHRPGRVSFPVGALRRLASPDLSRPGATITQREMEVLRLLASARSAPEIAETLSCRPTRPATTSDPCLPNWAWVAARCRRDGGPFRVGCHRTLTVVVRRVARVRRCVSGERRRR